MTSNRYGVACNPIVEKGDEEIMGPLITINPASVALAESCIWKNKSATNKGTLLHFISPNIPPLKISPELELWHRWVYETLR